MTQGLLARVHDSSVDGLKDDSAAVRAQIEIQEREIAEGAAAVVRDEDSSGGEMVSAS